MRGAAMLVLLAGCSNLVNYDGTVDETDTDLAADSDPGTDDGGSNNGGANNGGRNGDTNGTTNGGTNGDTDATSGDATSLVIVEIVDGSDHPGLRYVEVFNPTRAGVQVEGWALNVDHADGGPLETVTYRFPSKLLASGSSFVVCATPGADTFESLFGFPCDGTDVDVLGDGNDRLVLLDPDNRPKDAYGIREDGTGKVWEYTDSVVKRKAGYDAVYPYTQSQWTVSAGEDEANPRNRD